MPGRYEEGSPPTQEDYTGYEKDEATGLHYAGARYYSAAFGRFTTTDAFADKYPSFTPYQYGANNPASFIDVNGNTLDFSSALAADKEEEVSRTVAEASILKGENLTLNEDNELVPMEPVEGTEVTINGETFETKLVLPDLGSRSSTASQLLEKAISSEMRINVAMTEQLGSDGEPGFINLNPNQITNMTSGASGGLNSMTVSFGMTLIHEALHSFGERHSSNMQFGDVGSVAQTMNRIRSEMGSSFGQRLSYPARPVGGTKVLPFDQRALGTTKQGLVPSTMHIRGDGITVDR